MSRDQAAMRGTDVVLNALKVVGVAALIVLALWALTGSTGKRFFVEWGDRVVEVSPIEEYSK